MEIYWVTKIKISHTLKKIKGYYTQGDDNIKCNCTRSEQESYSFNNKRITALEQMHDIKQMYASDKKMHQLPSKNTKIPSKEHMPDIEKKKPPFTVSDTNILAKYQMTFS